MEEVIDKLVNHVSKLSLGKLKNIFRYHFGSNAYRYEEKNEDNKKDWLLVEAK